MIRTAESLCDEVGIFRGSSQEFRTAKNPFTAEERTRILKTVFPSDNVSVYPLPDIFIGNTARLGEYVLESVKKYFGMLPDLLVSGLRVLSKTAPKIVGLMPDQSKLSPAFFMRMSRSSSEKFGMFSESSSKSTLLESKS